MINPSKLFIVRPVATSLLMLAITLVGLLAYKYLPQAALPQVDYPTIQVVTRYAGANPETIAATVTSPLERQLGTIAGLNQMSSTSSDGISVIILQFDLELSLDNIVQSVQAALESARGFLPKELPSPPNYYKINPADAPIITLAVSPKQTQLSTAELLQLIETRVLPKLSQTNGVGLVSVVGNQRPALRIAVNSPALAHYGLDFEQLRQLLNQANSYQAKGNLDGSRLNYALDANTQLSSQKDYQQLIIKQQQQQLLRLDQIAQTTYGLENQQSGAWFNQQSAVLLQIQRQPNANVLQLSEEIKQRVNQLNQQLATQLELKIINDRSISVKHSLHEAAIDLLLAFVLVVVVVWGFLRSWSTTWIAVCALPLSMLSTLFVIWLLGFSINNLTIMALTIATGFMIDDTIVMIENISRHLEQGKRPLQAALDGAQEIGFTIIALTLSLVAVLIPLLFMPDVIGRLFREFAITLAVAIFSSAFISLTLTPMLLAHWGKTLRHQHTFFNRLQAYYGRLLNKIIAYRQWVLVSFLATVIVSIWAFASIAKGFFPYQDTGLIQGVAVAPTQSSFTALSRYQQQVSQQLLADEAVESVAVMVGTDALNQHFHHLQLQIQLKPAKQRANIKQVLARLHQLNQHLAVTLYLQAVQDLQVDTQKTLAQYQYSLAIPNPELLNSYKEPLLAKLNSQAALAQVNVTGFEPSQSLYIDINRDYASQLGIKLSTIQEALYSAFGQRAIGYLFSPSYQYRVLLQQADNQQGIDSLKQIYLQSSQGQAIPLTALAQISKQAMPVTITRERQFPALLFSFNVAEGYSLAQAISSIQQSVADLGLASGGEGQLQGTALMFDNALQQQILLIIAAITCLYIVLGILYEHFIHPITILSTFPSAVIGALAALYALQQDFNIVALIALILLIGIVQKNAIMVIDFALNLQRQQHYSPQQAIYQACLLRLRPILMTTCAAVFGAIPLALSVGAGGEFRQPLGIVMIGGLLMSQCLTLISIPAIYLAFSETPDSSKNIELLAPASLEGKS